MTGKPYVLELSEGAQKSLDKFDNSVRVHLIKWLMNKLDNIEDPRSFGGPLSPPYVGIWRYHGPDSIRVCVRIYDDEHKIVVADFRFRKKAYNR